MWSLGFLLEGSILLACIAVGLWVPSALSWRNIALNVMGCFVGFVPKYSITLPHVRQRSLRQLVLDYLLVLVNWCLVTTEVISNRPLHSDSRASSFSLSESDDRDAAITSKSSDLPP